MLPSENKFMCLVKDNTREEKVHQNNLWPVSELLLIFPVYYFVNGKGILTRPSFHSAGESAYFLSIIFQMEHFMRDRSWRSW